MLSSVRSFTREYVFVDIFICVHKYTQMYIHVYMYTYPLIRIYIYIYIQYIYVSEYEFMNLVNFDAFAHEVVYT